MLANISKKLPSRGIRRTTLCPRSELLSHAEKTPVNETNHRAMCISGRNRVSCEEDVLEGGERCCRRNRLFFFASVTWGNETRGAWREQPDEKHQSEHSRQTKGDQPQEHPNREAHFSVQHLCTLAPEKNLRK